MYTRCIPPLIYGIIEEIFNKNDIGYNKFINIIYSKYNFVNDRPQELPPDQPKLFKQTCASGC